MLSSSRVIEIFRGYDTCSAAANVQEKVVKAKEQPGNAQL